MRLLKNRIIISLVLIVLATYFWEFHVKPVSAPLYSAAVVEYRKQNYQRSLELLQQAYRIDPNDASILSLMGWNYLKLDKAKSGESYFERGHRLAPDVTDITLGYAYTEIALEKYDQAQQLLTDLRTKGVESADTHLAWGALYREQGKNREAVAEFEKTLAFDRNNPLAQKNLRQIYGISGEVPRVEFPAFKRPATLTYTARTEGERFAWKGGGGWSPVYLAGASLTPALPGHFPADPGPDPALYSSWLARMSDMGATTVRVYTILPPAFYRALQEFNTTSRRPLWLLQGVALGSPPETNDMFDQEYVRYCRQEIHDTIDVLHGQGDVASSYVHGGGIFNSDVSQWVAGILVGQNWPSYMVEGNDHLHIATRSYQGTYLSVNSGTATEVFLAQLLNYAAEYEEAQYNWQHPLGFANLPAFDPIHHPTESTLAEEISLRRSLGEHISLPPGPQDNDDSVTIDPNQLHPSGRLPAGYFAAYDVLPYYPDFLNYDPKYQKVQDAEGRNPFLGYLQDLKRTHPKLPLLISQYGIPSSLGIAHFSPAGFDEGGKTEEQQGQLLARFTRNIQSAGAAGGLVFEWIDQWYRHSWLVRNFETPKDRAPLWDNIMDPSEHFGLMAVDPHLRADHRLSGEPSEYEGKEPLYTEAKPGELRAVGDRYDPARDLKSLYVDADEAYLYLRLDVGRLDNDNDGRPDWDNVNYLIGFATLPERAGVTYLPFITPLRFPMGMTYAVQLAGPQASRIYIASTYNPFAINQVEGIPSQTVLGPKLGWKAELSDSGTFEPQIVEPNRRRFGRDGTYFPPQRYERGILRYGSLDPKAPDYDTLATWHANLKTNTIDIRIPWALLGVTDPSSLKVFTGLEDDGTVDTTETPGFMIAAFSFKPVEALSFRPIMGQGHAIADALPTLTQTTTLPADALKSYRWTGWEAPRFGLRLKQSYSVLRQAFEAAGRPGTPASRPANRPRPATSGTSGAAAGAGEGP